MSVGSKFYFLSFDNRQTLLEAPPPLAANVLQIGGRFNAANVLLALVALRGIRNNLKTKI